jgi:hypothetical protein
VQGLGTCNLGHGDQHKPPLAQSGPEQLTFNQWVGGSNPSRRTKERKVTTHMSMLFKFHGHLEGGHVRVRVFAGPHGTTAASLGVLMMRPAEWASLKLMQTLLSCVREDDLYDILNNEFGEGNWSDIDDAFIELDVRDDDEHSLVAQ